MPIYTTVCTGWVGADTFPVTDFEVKGANATAPIQGETAPNRSSLPAIVGDCAPGVALAAGYPGLSAAPLTADKNPQRAGDNGDAAP